MCTYSISPLPPPPLLNIKSTARSVTKPLLRPDKASPLEWFCVRNAKTSLTARYIYNVSYAFVLFMYYTRCKKEVFVVKCIYVSASFC